ncbi:NRPB10L [Symbiodinium sp. CCMP2456]|nr:NRPB10L [Symbiodinium sp. CCMP2456]
MAQVSLSIADLGNICIHLSSFLRSSEIASSEEAGICSKDVTRFLWRKAAMAHLAHIPIWGPSGNSVIQQLLDSGVQGKAFLRELRLLRQAVFPPKSWCPAIQETSFSILKVLPCTQAEDTDSHAQRDALVPVEAAVPLATGTRLGQPLAAGMELKAANDESLKAEDVSSGFCLGVEICSNPADDRSMSVMFAPFAGLCYMQYGGERCVMSATVLPPVEGTVSALRAWVQVTEEGGLFFLRQDPQSAKIEETGLIPKEALPSWKSEFFACMYFWRDHLLTPITSTVIHSEKMLPGDLPELEGSHIEVDVRLLSRLALIAYNGVLREDASVCSSLDSCYELQILADGVQFCALRQFYLTFILHPTGPERQPLNATTLMEVFRDDDADADVFPREEQQKELQDLPEPGRFTVLLQGRWRASWFDLFTDKRTGSCALASAALYQLQPPFLHFPRVKGWQPSLSATVASSGGHLSFFMSAFLLYGRKPGQKLCYQMRQADGTGLDLHFESSLKAAQPQSVSKAENEWEQRAEVVFGPRAQAKYLNFSLPVGVALGAVVSSRLCGWLLEARTLHRKVGALSGQAMRAWSSESLDSHALHALHSSPPSLHSAEGGFEGCAYMGWQWFLLICLDSQTKGGKNSPEQTKVGDGMIDFHGCGRDLILGRCAVPRDQQLCRPRNCA